MDSKAFINAVSRKTGRSQRWIAKQVGMASQLLNNNVNTGRLRLRDACRICDAVGLKIALFDMDTHKRIEFDTDEFLASGNEARFDDAVKLLGIIGLEAALVDAISGSIITGGRPGYGRRVRAWVDGIGYDTMRSVAISSGLNTDVYKFGGTGKYDVEDARELYKDSAGRYFIATYGEKRTDDRLDTCTPEEAREFIELHGLL